MTITDANINNKLRAVHWTFWLGLVFFIAVIVSLLTFSWVISERMAADETAPVTQVNISGEMPYTLKSEIQTIVEETNLSNFFKVDVNDIQQAVAKLPWVYSVSVRKQWPNELKIYVVDQVPVALWNGNFLINKEGVAFQADIQRLKQALPAFFGPEGSEVTALDNFTNLNNLLAFSDLAIEELVLSERFAWQLTLNDGVTLNLGRENRVERIQRFMDVYPDIIKNKTEDQQVNYVDLRYETGLAVGWKALLAETRA